MSDLPSKINVTAAVREDCDLADIMQLVAQRNEVTLIINRGTVVIQNQPGSSGGSTTNIGGPENMTKKTHIEATNSVVNNESDLRGVEILLNSPTSLLPPAEANVRETLKEFSAKLSQADAKHASDVELLKKRLEELAQQVTKPTAERKKSLLEMSAKGLKDAATAVGEIVPGLIATAEKVADAISRWLS